MIGDISVKTNLYLVSVYTDMRRSIDGLCATIQNMLHPKFLYFLYFHHI